MKHLHNYLLREVLLVFVAALGVLSVLMLLGNAVKQVLALMVNRQIPVPELIKAIGLLMPFVLVFALPIALLTSTLLVFGRFSADQEILAAKAGGVSLVSLISPVLLLATACSVLTAGLNMEWAPRSRVAFKSLAAGSRELLPENLLVPGQFITDFPNCTIYIGKRDGKGFADVLLYVFDERDDRLVQRINARRAKVDWKMEERKVIFHLEDAQVFFRIADGNEKLKEIGEESGAIAGLADDPEWSTYSFGAADQPIDIGRLNRDSENLKLSEMTFTQLKQELRNIRSRGIDPTPIIFQIHRQVSFSFACFVFVLVGIPLGIQSHRRETSAGIVVALILVMAYFGFMFLGQAMETRASAYPYLIVWIPNLLFTSAGFWLLGRADRGW